MIVIPIESKGPVFFRQTRVTAFGEHFRIFKFRTMYVDAGNRGPQITSKNDSRVTKIGRLIRRIRLDEIPQLLNIIKGEMTFVGTRPEVPRYVSMYTNEMMATLLLPAGVTSEASIIYKSEDAMLIDSENPDSTYVNRVLPEKMKYNLKSLYRADLFSDMRTLTRTILAMLGVKVKEELE